MSDHLASPVRFVNLGEFLCHALAEDLLVEQKLLGSLGLQTVRLHVLHPCLHVFELEVGPAIVKVGQLFGS